MAGRLPYRIFPLGDSAITIDFGNLIDEDINSVVIQLFHSLEQDPLHGMLESIPAYSSLSVYYDLFHLYKSIPAGQIIYEWMTKELEKRFNSLSLSERDAPRSIRIPVCYEGEFATDLEAVAMEKNMTPDQLIQIHSDAIYRVYMLGFLPGFAYMGQLDERLVMPRKALPQKVEPGSVGITGKQTGIYPLVSPGGWHILGRTPLQLFDASRTSQDAANNENPDESICLLRPGDLVQFYSINRDEFKSY